MSSNHKRTYDRGPWTEDRRLYRARRVRVTVLLLLPLLSLTIVLGQERLTAIRAAWLIDGTGRPLVADAVVLIKGTTIEAVGTRASLPVPPGAQVIDLTNQTLLPGMIDTHSHLNLRSPFPSRFGGPTQRDAPANEQMLKVVRHARVQLLCGITTLRQVGELHHNDILLRDAINAGMHVGPRIVSSALLVTVTGGHGYPGNWVDGPDAIRKLVRANRQHGAEWIKLSQTDLTPTTAQMSLEEMKAAVDEAHRLGMKVTVHATGQWGSAMRSAIEAGADNIEHAIPLTEEFVQLMLKKGITASLTPIVYVGWRPPAELYQTLDTGVNNCGEWMEHLAKQIQQARTAGGVEMAARAAEGFMPDPSRLAARRAMTPKVFQSQYLRAHQLGLPFSLGLDAQYGGIPWEMEFLVEGGIPPMDAIRAGTSVAAKLIGYGDRLRTIEKGKLADLISVEGNPIEDIKNMRKLRFIMKDGQRYDTLSWR